MHPHQWGSFVGVVMQKVCTRCRIERDLESFHRNSRAKDGRASWCRTCSRAYSKNWREVNPEYGSRWREVNPEYNRRWREANSVRWKEKSRQWAKANPEKGAAASCRYAKRYPKLNRALSAVHYAVKVGHLIRPETCEECGREGHIEAHHEDYSRPLNVVWLCRPCHGKTRRLKSVPPRNR